MRYLISYHMCIESLPLTRCSKISPDPIVLKSTTLSLSRPNPPLVGCEFREGSSYCDQFNKLEGPGVKGVNNLFLRLWERNFNNALNLTFGRVDHDSFNYLFIITKKGGDPRVIIVVPFVRYPH